MAQLPPNSVPLLRICTEKSILGFGKYADCTVANIMALEPQYIAYIYYSVRRVSFHKSILETLCIDPIEKPGTDAEALKRWNAAYRNTFTEEQRRNYALIKGAVRKRKALKALARAEAREEGYTSKAHLQAINHGHIK